MLNQRPRRKNLMRAVFFSSMVARASLDKVLEFTRLGPGGFTGGVLLNLMSLLIAGAISFRPNTKFLRVPIRIWAPYVAVVMFSILFTPDKFAAIRLLMSTLTFPAVFMAAMAFSWENPKTFTFTRIIINSSLIPAIVGVYQVLFIGGRIEGTFTHSNIFAFYLVIVAYAILYEGVVIRDIGNIRAKLYLLYNVLICVLLVATECRGAWIGYAVLILFYIVMVKPRLLILLVFIPSILLVPAISDRLTDLREDSGTVTVDEVLRGEVVLNSYAWRKMLWTLALEDLKGEEILGKGFGSFHVNAPRFFPLEQAADAHSGFIQARYEVGYIGFAAYCALYGAAAWEIWKRRHFGRRSAMLSIALVAVFLVINYSDNIPYYLSLNWYFWFAVGSDLGWRTQKGAAQAKSQTRVRLLQSA